MSDHTQHETIWYGNTPVSQAEKRQKVTQLFSDVAQQYDLMNDLMSLGAHRVWKNFMIDVARLRPWHRVLEIATGSADLIDIMAQKMPKLPQLLLTDLNPEMLKIGQNKLLDKGICANWAIADGENLPLCDRSQDRVLLSFGLRNMTCQEKCLKEIYRVLAPGGVALIMEFSMDIPPSLRPIYDAYSLKWLPTLGQWIAGNSAGYLYLAESIRKQTKRLQMIEQLNQCGFTKVLSNKLSLGQVVLYRAYR